MPKKRLGAFFTVLIIYTIAFLGFLGVIRLTNQNLLLSSFWGDIAATAIVWLFGMLYKNSSIYDPYWSVAPLFIAAFWIVFRHAPLGGQDLLFLAALLVWGLRLTINWAVRWRGMAHQDWRYTQLRGQAPRWWFLTNLGGINLMPTLLVFGGLIPVYVAFFFPGAANPHLLGVGFAACVAAAGIQLAADREMDAHKRQANHQCIDKGIWRYSRHPNYFGEVLFWWGIWLMQLGVNPGIWITAAGPLMITLLFTCISIPLMEKHLAAKPGYALYRKQVSALIPWFRKTPEADLPSGIIG